MKKYPFRTSLLTLFLFTAPTCYAAGDYYVDKNSTRASCSDSNTGTLAAPFCTIQKAIQYAAVGTTINIMSGNYGALTISGLNGASGSPITFRAYQNDQVILDGQQQDVVPLDVIDSSYLIFDGLEVVNGHSPWNAGVRLKRSHYSQVINSKIHDNLGSNTSGIMITGGHNNMIDNNQIYNNYMIGIWVEYVSGPSYENILSNNVIHDHLLANGNSDGITLTAPNTYNNQIIGNVVYNNGDDGIDVFNSPGNLIKNNISYGNINPNGDGNGFKVGGFKNNAAGGYNTIIGNISYGNRTNGFDSNGSPGNKYYFNVSYNNLGFGFENGWEGSTCSSNCTTEYINNIGLDNSRANLNVGAFQVVSHNNIWFDRSTGNAKVSNNYTTYNTLDAFATASGGLDNPNNGALSSISANPLFMNLANGDFHLQAGSPAIDKGITAGSVDKDFEGNNRPQGAGYDIGAFEYATAPDITAPTLSEVTAVASPTTDNTPNYVFNSSEAGTISYGGTCNSTKTSATAGNNTITFNTLSVGNYSNCSIRVTDTAGNVSNILNVSPFEVIAAPVLDSTPDQFTFIDVIDANTNTVYISNPISVTGINTATSISINGGSYRINANSWTNNSSSVNQGDTVEIKLTSSRKTGQTVSASLDIGGVTDTYSVSTSSGSTCTRKRGC